MYAGMKRFLTGQMERQPFSSFNTEWSLETRLSITYMHERIHIVLCTCMYVHYNHSS